MQLSERELKEYEKLGIAPPTVVSHGVTPDDIRSQMKRLDTFNWKLEGNRLTCDTSEGPFSQWIDPNYILTGTDEFGLPILTKIEL